MKPKIFLISLLNLVFSLYLLILWWQNKLTYYIHVRYVWYIFASAIFVFCLSFGYLAFAIFSIFIRRQNWSEWFHKLTSFLKSQIKTANWFTFTLTIFFVVILFIPAVPLGVNNAVVVSSLGSLSGDSAPPKPLPKNTLKQNIITNLNIEEWSKLLQNDIQLKTYKNQRLEVTGFVSDLNGQASFEVSRYVIVCCALDASMITIPVKISDSITNTNLKNGDWVDITGHFSLENIDNQNQPTIVLENLKKVPVPNDPYIYYN
jgi:uncharacterized repeat protein (TIGR03943 family)